MTTILVLTLVLALILTLYGVTSSLYERSINPMMPTVEAGPVNGINYTEHARRYSYREKQINPNSLISIDGNLESIRDYLLLSVVGGCMDKIGIKDGSIVAARVFDKSVTTKDKKDNLKRGDALLIYLNDHKYKGYKIRLYDKENSKGRADTYYFEQGVEHPSGNDGHKYENILGIVKAKIA